MQIYIGSDICFEDSGTATTIVPHRHVLHHHSPCLATTIFLSVDLVKRKTIITKVFGFEKTLVVSVLDEAKEKERPSQIAYFPGK